MKQTFDLLAEVLSLPYSEIFLEKDLLADCIPDEKKAGQHQRERVMDLNKAINRLGLQVAKYVNRHTAFLNIDDLQSIINYVFNAEDILHLAKDISLESLNPSAELANAYHIMLIKRIAKTFISSRDGKAVVKYWPGSSEAYPNWDQLPSGITKPLWDRDILGNQPGPHRIEAWHSLLQRFPESLLLSCYSVCLTEAAPLSYGQQRDACFRTLFCFGDTVHIADMMLDKLFDKGLAETHLHAKASRSFDLIWETDLDAAVREQFPLSHNHDLVFHPEVRKEEHYRQALEAVILRTVLASFLATGGVSLQKYVMERMDVDGLSSRGLLLKSLDELSRGKPVVGGFSSAVTRVKPFLEKMSGATWGYLPHILHLPGPAYLTDPGLAERYFIAWSLLYITRAKPSKTPDTAYSAAFLYYLRLKIQCYRNRIQDSKSKGLSYFRKFYSISTDSGSLSRDTELLHIVSTALRDKRVLKTELRFAPPISRHQTLDFSEREIASGLEELLECFISQHLHALATLFGIIPPSPFPRMVDSYQKRWEQAVYSIRQGSSGVLSALLREFSVDPKSVHPHRMGLLLHLIKKGEDYENASCFLKCKNGSPLEKYAAFSFGTARFQYQATVQAIRRLRRICPAIGRLMIGLDAASQELPTEPWVFAPAFRLAREPESVPSGLTFMQADGEHRLLGITYHVGEEFHHPLSGLRHIGEAISFFKMHSGDRLGHALALGIDLDYWYNKHKMIAISCVEWMEDCLWAWEIAATALGSADISEYIKFLETQILSCAHQIYGTLNGISVEKLCNAYRSKTLGYSDLCEIVRRWEQKYISTPIDCQREGSKRDFFPCAQKKSLDREFWWSEDSLALSHHCSFYKNKMSKEVMRELTAKEVALTKHLQNYLRKVIAEKGIILEENPSSNAVIGEMDGVMSHPICTLRSTKSQESVVIATINTDDPSVFNSNVANEHALIYFALLHHGCSVEESIKIVDEIREAGLTSSFLPDVPPFEKVLEEYEQILHHIKSI